MSILKVYSKLPTHQLQHFAVASVARMMKGSGMENQAVAELLMSDRAALSERSTN